MDDRVPKGRLNQGGNGDVAPMEPSRWDSEGMGTGSPAIQSLGYDRASLRDVIEMVAACL